MMWAMNECLKIGQLARSTGLTTKAIRYYESRGLLPEPRRTGSGYRLYSDEDIRRLEFVKQAKRLGLSLDDIRDILTLHDRNQPPCIHVLALLDQKLAYLDSLIQSLREFRAELGRLRQDSAEQLSKLPAGAAVCGIVERGIHAKGELALTWLEAQERARRVSRRVPQTP
jgi:DNA-binding transcriptional MerR regulator